MVEKFGNRKITFCQKTVWPRQWAKSFGPHPSHVIVMMLQCEMAWGLLGAIGGPSGVTGDHDLVIGVRVSFMVVFIWRSSAGAHGGGVVGPLRLRHNPKGIGYDNDARQ